MMGARTLIIVVVDVESGVVRVGRTVKGRMVVAEMVWFEFVVGVLMVAGVVKGIVVAVAVVARIFSNRCSSFVAEYGDESVHAREHSRLGRLDSEVFRVV
jgi:hypothetical protein